MVSKHFTKGVGTLLLIVAMLAGCPKRYEHDDKPPTVSTGQGDAQPARHKRPFKQKRLHVSKYSSCAELNDDVRDRLYGSRGRPSDNTKN